MKMLISSFLFASIIFLIIDILWLSYSVKVFYRPQLGSLLLDKPILWAAIVFYLIYMLGILIIIIQPALEKESIFHAFWTGFIFGIVAYGTYNFTNMATVKNWSAYVVFVDTTWGGLLTGSSSAMGIFLSKKLFLN